MKRPWVVPVILAASILLLAVVVSGRTPALSRPSPERIETSGVIFVDDKTVTAPAIDLPSPDIGVGVRSGPAVTQGDARTPRATRGRAVAGVLTSVPVSAASQVVTGDLIAAFDDRMLRLGYETARARSRQSRQDLARVREALDELEGRQADLDAAKVELASALAKGRSARSRVSSQLTRLRRRIDSMPTKPPSLPPSAPPVPPGPPMPDPRVAEGKLSSALAKLNAALGRAAAAQRELAEGQTKLDEARATLNHAKPVLAALVGVADAETRVARAEIARTRVLSPYSGLVVDARPAGEVAMVGSPLAIVRRRGPLEIEVFLSPSEAARVSVGTKARVRIDSRRGEVFGGRITRTGDAYVFPPSDRPTTEIHPDRSLPVFVTLEGSPGLPPGTWADVTLETPAPHTGK